MKPIEYLAYQLELEGIRRVENGQMSRIHPNSMDFPLLLHTRLSDGQSLIFLDDLLPLEVRDQLYKNDPEAFEAGSSIKALNKSGINAVEKHFRTYIFPESFLPVEYGHVKCFTQDDPKVEAFGFSGLATKVFGIERNGSILSACVSSRQNSTTAEAWVLTHPDHRGRGLAQQVAAAWAVDLLGQGIIPFYSHDIDNINSGKLARKLGLIYIFDETVIEKID